MRALFVSYELPPIGGGGGRAALEIARRLPGMGCEVDIVSSRFGELPETENRDGVTIHRLNVSRKSATACTGLELLSFIVASLKAAPRLAKKVKADVLCAFFGIPGGPCAWWTKRKLGTPYLLSLRGSDVPRAELSRHQKLHGFTRPALRRIYRAADGIIAVSDSLRLAALKVEPDVCIDVIPNGVDTKRFCASGHVFPYDTLNLIYVGRLRDFKRVQDVILALPDIGRSLGKPVRLKVVGDGPHHQKLAELTAELDAKDVGARVEFTGWLEQEKLCAAYRSADIMVLPSLVEGFPNVLLEAMASGLPCVATDVPGTRDVFQHGREGLYVPPMRPDLIAQAVIQIASQKETWAEMSRAARALAERCSWERIAEQYHALLRQAAEGAR